MIRRASYQGKGEIIADCAGAPGQLKSNPTTFLTGDWRGLEGPSRCPLLGLAVSDSDTLDSYQIA